MNTLYIECAMGASGDMLMAALLEVCPDPEKFLHTMNTPGIPGVRIERSAAVKCGITGTGVSVRIFGGEETPEPHTRGEAGHAHTPAQRRHDTALCDITAIIGGLPVSGAVKSHALAVYGLIAEAESAVHGVAADEIHFHEVGNLDAIADIVGVCVLMEMIAPGRVLASPVNVGFGQVKTSHGILPVPAPATARILKGIPVYSGRFEGEMCTPTGAALLKHFAQGFCGMPVMRTASMGYGMGKKDFEAANCVRVFLGDSEDECAPNDEIAELSCNLDDMTPEAVGFVIQLLREEGALDVFVTPIHMKKDRPAHCLTCLCTPRQASRMALLMLKNTSTIGLRQKNCRRYVMASDFSLCDTPYGAVRVKTSAGYGLVKIKPEYEDVARCAAEHGAAFDAVYRAAIAAAEKKQ
jgi:TIGR00299 family protein